MTTELTTKFKVQELESVEDIGALMKGDVVLVNYKGKQKEMLLWSIDNSNLMNVHAKVAEYPLYDFLLRDGSKAIRTVSVEKHKLGVRDNCLTMNPIREDIEWASGRDYKWLNMQLEKAGL